MERGRGPADHESTLPVMEVDGGDVAVESGDIRFFPRLPAIGRLEYSLDACNEPDLPVQEVLPRCRFTFLGASPLGRKRDGEQGEKSDDFQCQTQ